MIRHRVIKGNVALLFFSLLMLTAQPLQAAPHNLESIWRDVGQIGGPTQAVAVQGNYAYVGVGLRLIVLDVSNPTTPTEVGSTTPFPHFVEDIAIDGTRAYVAAGGSGLRVVDISNPANPIEIGAWNSPGYAEGVAVTGNTVYLADGPYGLRTVDISDPANPTPIGSAYDMNYTFDVAVSGNHAYIAAAGAGLLVADVTDPAHPLKIGTLDTPGYAYGIAVSSTTVYIADGWEGVRLVDVSSPNSPTEVSAYKTPGWAFDIAVFGTTAYVADAFMGLRILDVSNPTHLTELGGYEAAGGHAGNVAVVGNVAYVADRNSGLRALDVSDPLQPSQVGLYNPMGNAKEISISGGYAFVGAGDYGLRIVDISQPTHPIQTGALDIGGKVNFLEVVTPYAYICTFSAGSSLFIVDISNPTQPALLGQIQLMGMCRDLDVDASIAYIANEWGLELISLSDPYHPAHLGFLQMQEGSGGPEDLPVGVAVSGTLAYVASSYAGLEVVDVSNPVSPTLVGAYNSGESFSQDVVLQGNRAYIADYFGLRIVDISDPYNPIGLGFYATPGEVYRVAVSETLAYVAVGHMGVYVVDVSNPYTPTLVGSFNTPGYAYETAVSGGRIYVGDSFNGLLILEPWTSGGFTQIYRKPVAGNVLNLPPLSWHAQLTDQVGLILGEQPYNLTNFTPTNILFARQTDRAAIQLLPNIPSPSHIKSSSTTQLAEGTSSAVGAYESSIRTCVVTITADSDVGSLRDCLENAVSDTRITFDPFVFPPANPVTINLMSDLPKLDDGQVTLDASNAGVILDGSASPPGTSGLVVCSDHNTIQGLQILRFPDSGIFLQCGQYNLIGGDRFIGSSPLGQGNMLSENGGSGININGSGTNNNTVSGNLVGTDIHGTSARGNGAFGIFLAGECSNNIIGGTMPGERNIVSNNMAPGISMMDSAHGNLVIGNYVGTDITGSFALGNRGNGISMELGAYDNRVEGNLSSGNGRYGLLADASNYNVFVGNMVGTDASGTKAIPNNSGIFVGYEGASFNRIGGTGPGEGNLVSGNNDGIQVGGEGAVGNLVLGNIIGTDKSVTQILSNHYGGLRLGPGRTIAGGATPAERNIISGNSWPDGWPGGVTISSDYSVLAGNFIGMDGSGTHPIPNQGVGVWLRAAEHSFIQGNLIAYNTNNGIFVESYGFNTLRRNTIYGHGGPGIFMAWSDNQLLAPVITAITATSVSGTTCPGCIVEVFSDDKDEGQVYEGSVVASSSGEFTFTKPTCLVGPFVTATATDQEGNTSEFSTTSQSGTIQTYTITPESSPAPSPTLASPTSSPGMPKELGILLGIVLAAVVLGVVGWMLARVVRQRSKS